MKQPDATSHYMPQQTVADQRFSVASRSIGHSDFFVLADREHPQNSFVLNRTANKWCLVSAVQQHLLAAGANGELLRHPQLQRLLIGPEVEKSREYPLLSHVLINLTNECSLRCRYCYNHRRGSMSRETAANLARQLCALPQREVRVLFHGGEPFLNFAALTAIVELCRQMGPGKSFTFQIQSNGTNITDVQMNFLRANSIDLGLSIDGPAEVHDGARQRQDGRGSLANILELIGRWSPDRFFTTAVIHRGNQGRILEIVDFYRQHGIKDFHFCLFKPDDTQDYLTPDINALIDSIDPLFDYYVCWKKQDHGVYCHNIERALDAFFCDYYAASCISCTSRPGEQVLMIDADGSIFECDFYCKPDRALSNVNAAPYALLASLDSPRNLRRRIDVDDIPACRDCIWKNYCCAGCLAEIPLEGLGKKPSFYCRYYFAFYAHAALRLPQLRGQTPLKLEPEAAC